MRHFLRVLVVAATLALPVTAANAQTSVWVWSESYAEQMVTQHVRYVSQVGIANAEADLADKQANYDDSQQKLAAAQQGGNANEIAMATAGVAAARSGLMNAQDWVAEEKQGYAPDSVNCIGGGRAYGGYRFRSFRCSVIFVGAKAQGRVFVQVLGQTKMKYSWI